MVVAIDPFSNCSEVLKISGSIYLYILCSVVDIYQYVKLSLTHFSENDLAFFHSIVAVDEELDLSLTLIFCWLRGFDLASHLLESHYSCSSQRSHFALYKKTYTI